MAKKTVINKEYVGKFVAEKGYPEVGTFEDKKDLQKFYKHLDDAQLLEWIELEGLEFTPNDSEPINRMRMCMSVLYLHFPKAPTSKKKSKYAEYSNESLIEMAIKHDVVFEMCDDERILRMRAIMALRAHNILE